jgi:hypothetical protein
MAQIKGSKTARASAEIPVKENQALRQMARDNQRSVAGEIRVAIHNHLKNDGRIVG